MFIQFLYKRPIKAALKADLLSVATINMTLHKILDSAWVTH